MIGSIKGNRTDIAREEKRMSKKRIRKYLGVT
jgi:hypothetical protein